METAVHVSRLVDDTTQQTLDFKEAIFRAIHSEPDMVIVSKDKQLIPCHMSLLTLYSPVIGRLLAEAPCCTSPTIFLPDFVSLHIKKLLIILKFGQAIPGDNVNVDIRIISKIADGLKISMTDFSVGPFNDNPLGLSLEVKQELQEVISVTEVTEIKEEANKLDLKKEMIEVKQEELEKCEYIEEDETDVFPKKELILDDFIITDENSSKTETFCNIGTKYAENATRSEEDTSIERKTLSGAYELKRHIRRVHLGERERSPKPRSRGKGDFVCNVCNKTLSGAYELKRHKTQKHQEDKPFPCDFCKKTFADRNKLMIHRRTHTGEKPFACDNCPKAFTAVCKLNWHIKNECQKIFLCKECGKTFSGDYELNRHIKHLHLDAVRPYSCELCPKTFFEPSKLELHVRTHTGERPFPCDLCVKAFVSKSKLKLHKDMVHGVSEQLFNYEDNESSEITMNNTCTKNVKTESE